MSDNIVGPVCHIPAATQPGNPQPKNIPGVSAPPTDLPSALRAIYNLQQIIRQLVNDVTNNNISNSSNQKSKPGDFVVQNVTYKTTRVYQNGDTSSPNYVDIKQVSTLELADKNKNTWTYTNNG